jgi:putative copper export protein
MRAAEISAQPVSGVFPVLPTVILRTHYGRVWLLRVIALVLLSVGLMARKRSKESRGYLFSMLTLAVVVAATESASGHASDKGDLSIPEIVDWLHLLGTSVWGGGLLVLSLFILPALVAPGDRSAPLIADAAGKFSRIAGYAVGIVGITAVYNALLFIGSYEALSKAPYGKAVIVKTILFILLLLLGAVNRYVNVPSLRRWADISPHGQGIADRIAALLSAHILPGRSGPDIARRFAKSVKVESLLIIAVLLCAAFLRHQVPARHFVHLEHTATHRASAAQDATVSLQTDPERIVAGLPVAITARLRDNDGKPLGGIELQHERILHAIIIGKDLNIFAHIHPEDLGPVTDEMVKGATFPLQFTFPKAGHYLIGIDFAAFDQSYSRSFPLSVTGKPVMGEPLIDLSTEKNFGEYRVSLQVTPGTVKAGEEATLSYAISKGGREVTDLTPYLGAAMHLAVVPTDLGFFIHTHGVTPGEPHMHHDHMHANPPKSFGPRIDADVVFPAGGIYKIFSQVRHGDRVLLFDFMLKVP